MQPTDHELTVAVDAAARRLWDETEQHRFAISGDPARRSFDDLDEILQTRLRETVVGLVLAALQAVPDRAPAARYLLALKVAEHMCLCLTAEPPHDSWCPASVVEDELEVDLTHPPDETAGPGAPSAT